MGKEVTTVASIEIDNGMCVLRMASMCILDWDHRSTSKPEGERERKSGNITINQANDAYGLLAKSVMQESRELWAIYETWGGVRAFMMHQPMEPNEYQAGLMVERLSPDPAYIRYCKEQESWAARVSRKPGRSEAEDKINFVGFLGNGTAYPEMVRGLNWHHFLLMQNEMTQDELPKESLKTLKVRDEFAF